MSLDHPRRSSTAPNHAPPAPPVPPPLPPPRYSQQARNALNRVFNFAAWNPGQHQDARRTFHRLPSLSSYNASASHKTGKAINSMSINEQGTHALLAGREIFKTVKVDEGACTEDVNIRLAIRGYDASTSTNPSASTRPKDAADLHDVAWAKGGYGNFIAAATYNGPIVLYDLAHLGIEVARLFDHRRQVHRVTFNPHAGHLMLSASQDGTVRLWDLRDCQRNVSTFNSHFSIPGQADGIRDVKWSPTNGTEFALGTDAGWIQKWDLTMSKAAKVKIAAHSAMCSTIDWHPDGKHLLSASADKSVKVWNLAIEGRRQKAAYEIKTPYPLRNARWRPPCQSSIPQDNRARQCTQVVTSYEKDYPMLHVWDLRRPLLPFRELECFETAPTDLLWHSQDLLWTVGREGTFLQNDITYSPKIIDRRSVQACAVSPLGEINHITQRRLTRPRPSVIHEDSDDFIPLGSAQDTKLDKTALQRIGRGSADDSLDESFLSATYKKAHKRSTSLREGKSSVNTPPSNETMSDRTLNLDSILSKWKSTRPAQAAARGLLPGAPNVLLFTYFSQKYKSRPYAQPPSVQDMLNIHDIFEQNAKFAQLASMYRMAQSWRIVGQIVSKELLRRAMTCQRRRMNGYSNDSSTKPGDSPIVERARKIYNTEKERGSKPNTPLARPRRITESLQIGQTEASTSNVPTPLAKPTTSTAEASSHGQSAALLDIDHDGGLALPPLMLSPLSYRSTGGVPRITSDQDQRDSQRVVSGSPEPDAVEKYKSPRDWPSQYQGPLNLEPLYGNGVNVPPRLTKHDSDESFGMFPSLSSSRNASLPDSLTSSKSQLMDIVQENLMNSNSHESRRWLGLHTLSSGPDNMSDIDMGKAQSQKSGSMVSDASLPPLYIGDLSREASQSQELSYKKGGDTAAPRDVFHDMQILARNNQESFVSESETLSSMHNSAHESENNNLDASVTVIRETDRGQTRSRQGTFTKPAALTHATVSTIPPGTNRTANGNGNEDKDGLVVDDFFASGELTGREEGCPLPMITMLTELLAYHTTVLSDAQASSYLLFLVMPLLPETHNLSQPETDITLAHYSDHLASLGSSDDEVFAILQTSFEHLVKAGLQPLQAESIFMAYHDQLKSLSLLNEAAYLRRLAYPTFPGVYEQGLKDNQVSLRCGGCKKPINNPTNKLRCESCLKRQGPCPVCWSTESPYEVAPKKRRKGQSGVPAEKHEAADHTTSTKQQANGASSAVQTRAVLYSTCLQCNHSAHAACLAQWHGSESTLSPSVESGGACPSLGCPCRCIGGGGTPAAAEKVRAEQAAARRRTAARIADDDWLVGESKAVGSARRSLGGAGPEVRKVDFGR